MTVLPALEAIDQELRRRKPKEREDYLSDDELEAEPPERRWISDYARHAICFLHQDVYSKREERRKRRDDPGLPEPGVWPVEVMVARARSDKAERPPERYASVIPLRLMANRHTRGARR